jgi:hypothetical protein
MSEPIRLQRIRFICVAAGAATVALLASACGGSTGATVSSVASESPSQVLAAAVSATKAATSYEVSASGTFSTGITSFDLKVVGADISGSYVLNGATVDLVDSAGTIYIKAPASFYTTEGASAVEAALLAVGWVEIPSSSSYAADFSSLSNFTDVASQLEAAGTVTSGGTGSVDGQAVDILKNTSGSTLDVASSGTAYPVQVTETAGTEAGTYKFSDWDGVPTFTAPPSALQLPS